MKNRGRLWLILLFATGMVLSSLATVEAAEQEQSPASATAPVEKVEPHPETVLKKSGEVAITKTCGCEANCPEGFNPSEATTCYTPGGECKEKGSKCTLTCKKGKDEKKVD